MSEVEERMLYRDRLRCGCRCIIAEVAAGLHDETAFIEVKISPFRLQRCFRHMNVTPENVRAEFLAPLTGIWGG